MAKKRARIKSAAKKKRNMKSKTKKARPVMKKKYRKRLVKKKQKARVMWGGGKKNKPDRIVKRNVYSKGLRVGLLSSADVRQKFIEMGGENTINIIREFDKDMSDEDLARKTGIKTSDVRVVLNRLHSHGFFSYTRTRDRDSGWYSYIWKMSKDRLQGFVDGAAKPVGERTNISEGDVYHCRSCSPEKMIEFADAFASRFKCEKCGGSLAFFERKIK